MEEWKRVIKIIIIIKSWYFHKLKWYLNLIGLSSPRLLALFIELSAGIADKIEAYILFAAADSYGFTWIGHGWGSNYEVNPFFSHPIEIWKYVWLGIHEYFLFCFFQVLPPLVLSSSEYWNLWPGTWYYNQFPLNVDDF